MVGAVRTTVGLFLLALLAGCALLPPAPPQGNWQPAQDLSEITEQELLVTIPLSEPKRINRLGTDLRQAYSLEFLAEWPIKSLNIHCFVFRLPAGQGTDLSTVINRLQADARIDSVQPMKLFETLSQSQPYNDVYLDLQHSLTILQAPQAHRWATGKGVKVGVVDTGIDTNHPDLTASVVLAKNFVGDHATDTVAETHGTAVAGVIGAQANNRIGIVGVAPEAELIGLRGCWQDVKQKKGYCSSFTLARAINFAIVQQLDVLNLSLQGPDDPLLARLLRLAISDGMTVVAAYQRGQPGGVAFPASLPGVLAVTAVEESGAPAVGAFSTADDQPPLPAALHAPGTDVLTTMPNNGYNFNSGSSFATAHIAGIVALMKEHAPNLRPTEIAVLLRENSQPVSTVLPGVPARAGAVQVNACTALAALGGTTVAEVPGYEDCIDFAFNDPESAASRVLQ